MKKNIVAFLYCLYFLFCALFPLGAEQFFYKYAADKYRIISQVNEDVYINRRFSHKAHILNRCAVEVSPAQNGGAAYKAVFQTAEQILEGRQLSFRWASEYDSAFRQDRLGRMTIEERYYMPVVRDVPVFPDRDLKPGESWSADGHEMHDFRKSFGIEKPYRIPFRADYVFLGDRAWKGKTYPAFSVSYRIFYEPPAVTGTVWPRRILGASDQIVYWDREQGMAAAYEETFRMVFELSNGSTVEYRGTADAEIVESETMKKEELAREIEQEIQRHGIDDASVKIVDEGITISLENIQFRPDSAAFMESERAKLDKIGQILRRYPDRDILVGGHAAQAGSAAWLQKLSEDRAAAVSDYLISHNIRAPSRIVVRGYGADKPLASNTSTEGMKKNRRVEIILLEN